jgi:hypothetical protein
VEKPLGSVTDSFSVALKTRLLSTDANTDVKGYEQADEVGVACSTMAEEHFSQQAETRDLEPSRRHCPGL